MLLPIFYLILIRLMLRYEVWDADNGALRFTHFMVRRHGYLNSHADQSGLHVVGEPAPRRLTGLLDLNTHDYQRRKKNNG